MHSDERRLWFVAAIVGILAVGILVGWMTSSALKDDESVTPTANSGESDSSATSTTLVTEMPGPSGASVPSSEPSGISIPVLIAHDGVVTRYEVDGTSSLFAELQGDGLLVGPVLPGGSLLAQMDGSVVRIEEGETPQVLLADGFIVSANTFGLMPRVVLATGNWLESNRILLDPESWQMVELEPVMPRGGHGDPYTHIEFAGADASGTRISFRSVIGEFPTLNEWLSDGPSERALHHPGDGRYGIGYPRDPWPCEASTQPSPKETVYLPRVSPEGRTLAWAHHEVQADPESPSGQRSFVEVRAIDLATGQSGAVRLPVVLSPVTSLTHLGEALVVSGREGGDLVTFIVDLSAGDLVRLPWEGQVSIPRDAFRTDPGVVPPGELSLPVPDCPAVFLSIYGWGEIRVGAPLSEVPVADYFGRAPRNSTVNASRVRATRKTSWSHPRSMACPRLEW